MGRDWLDKLELIRPAVFNRLQRSPILQIIAHHFNPNLGFLCGVPGHSVEDRMYPGDGSLTVPVPRCSASQGNNCNWLPVKILWPRSMEPGSLLNKANRVGGWGRGTPEAPPAAGLVARLFEYPATCVRKHEPVQRSGLVGDHRPVEPSRLRWLLGVCASAG